MIQLYSLAVFLTGNVREAASTVRAKNAPLEIISELAAKQLSLPPQVVFEAILTREKWAVPVSAMVLQFRMANWKKILCVPLAFSFSSKRL